MSAKPSKFPWVNRLIASGKVADARVNKRGGWTTKRPTRRGMWFAAKWQHSGYYHVQRYLSSTPLKDLLRDNAEWWCGPFPKSEEGRRWTRHVICFLPKPAPSGWHCPYCGERFAASFDFEQHQAVNWPRPWGKARKGTANCEGKAK